MINLIISEINSALDNNLYLAALALALTLPDVCGKAEYPNERVGYRYKKWYDEWMGQYEHPPGDTTMPYLSGEVVYSLRCCFLHESNPTVDNDKLTINDEKPIDIFELVKEKKNPVGIYSSASCVTQDGTSEVREYRMNIRQFCEKMCWIAEAYYRDNSDKFSFNYKIIDWDEVIAHLPKRMLT